MSDNLSKTKRTSQAMDNFSFDESYLQNTQLILTENEDGTSISRQKTIATEETLQAVLSAQGGSTYNFIQSATDSLYKFYGYASSTGWKIKRKTLASGVWEVAEGLGDYDTAFSDRANKSYSYTS